MTKIKKFWNIDDIRSALDRYISEYGRLPTAKEMDRCKYLPSARTIQRSYHGLEFLRQSLGYEQTHFGKGANRSQIAREINTRGSFVENQLREYLVDKFGEIFVHLERPIYKSSKQRVDFYVYTNSETFAVDIFYPKDADTMVRCLYYKEKTYENFKVRLYLVIANLEIGMDHVEKYVNSKKIGIRDNFRIVTLELFKQTVQDLKPHNLHPNEMGDKKVFAFKGQMGAGKTTFITALCQEYGVEDTMSSPTFSIIS